MSLQFCSFVIIGGIRLQVFGPVGQELRMEARISLLPQPTAVYVKEAAIP